VTILLLENLKRIEKCGILGSHSGRCEESVFWDITLSIVHRKSTDDSKERVACLSPAFTLVSCSACFSTLKMEVTCSSEMSIDFQRITWRYIPEDRTLFIKEVH
jgi:hypothetical protein